MNFQYHHLPILLSLAALAPPSRLAAKPPTALPHAHAHNDYNHKRPLWDALDRGFVSIEADVFLKDGQLLVGHDEKDLHPDRTLKALYLDPLQKHIAANDGRVFAGDERLTLLVDFKSAGAATYSALAALLVRYDGVFSEMKEGQWTPHAIDVIITGNRPTKEIAADPARRVAIDGRLADTRPDARPDLVPMISENWRDHFTWRGQGPMPPADRSRLSELSQRVHRQGRRLRFWGAPDNPAVWTEQRAAGIDLLNADDLASLQKFLTHRPQSTNQ